MSRTPYRAEIELVASKHGLSPDVVEAQVLVESAGYTDGFRLEMGFWTRYMLPKAEWAFARSNPRRYASSYGLLQVMYPVAKELGFTGEPELLFIPMVGLEWGCAKLAQLLAWAQTSGPAATPGVQLHSALAAYNGGKARNEPDDVVDRNALYADRVLRMVRPA